MSYLVRLAVSAVALWIATLIAVAVIFGLINMFLRPIIKMLGCGLYVLTLGLIAIVVNGLLFWLVSWIAGGLNLPFHVENFWPSAVFGALVVGVVSWLLNLIVPDGKGGGDN